MAVINSVIIGCGSYLPQKVLSNKDLEKMMDTSDEWIVSRTGITQRHIAADDELVSQMAAKAGKEAIKKAGITEEDIDLLILATTTPDKTFPASAVITQSILGIKKGAAFDVQAVCSGFVYAIAVADSMIKSGQARNALVIGADKMSAIVNWQDRKTCILFGDGAGAVVVRASSEEGAAGIMGYDLNSDGNYKDILYTDGGVGSTGSAGKLVMLGQEVFKHAISKMASSLESVIKKAGLSKNDINWLVPHQANARIIESLAKRLDFPEEKIIRTVDKHANTSAASIPLALDHAISNGYIKKGDVVAVAAIGGGLSWGSLVFRF